MAVKAQDRAPVQGAESRALYSESQANVAAQHLCRPSGTDRSANDGGCVKSMENKRQRDKAVSGGSGRAGSASWFPGSELQVESRADVAWTDAMINDGEGGGLMGSELQQGKVACKGDNRRPRVAHCFLGPELRAGSQVDVAQGSVTADSGAIGGSLGGKRQQGEAAQGDGARGAGAASGFLGPELQDRAGGRWFAVDGLRFVRRVGSTGFGDGFAGGGGGGRW